MHAQAIHLRGNGRQRPERLPPVPASASLLSDKKGQSRRHQQARNLLLGMESVVNFQGRMVGG